MNIQLDCCSDPDYFPCRLQGQTVQEHCAQGKHCVGQDACCAVEWRNGDIDLRDHKNKCCECGAQIKEED